MKLPDDAKALNCSSCGVIMLTDRDLAREYGALYPGRIKPFKDDRIRGRPMCRDCVLPDTWRPAARGTGK